MYTLLIPAYNAGQTISKLLSQIDSIGEKPQKIIVVDDGSQDDTSTICQDHDVEILSHEKNKGKGRALKTGFEALLGQEDSDYLLCMDADLQHPVASIPDFLQKAGSGSRFIIGSRDRSLKAMPPHRILSNTITSFILSIITGQRIEDSQCGYRMVHRDVINKLQLNEDGYQLESEMLLEAARNDIKIDFIPIPTIYNDEKSHMGNFSDTIKFIRLIFKYILGSLLKRFLAAPQRRRENDP